MVKHAKLNLEIMPKSSVKDILERTLDNRGTIIFDNCDIKYSNKKHMENYLKNVRRNK